MDSDRFDDLVRLLSTASTRRPFLRRLATAVGLLALGDFRTADAKKKGKKKKKKLKLNQFGCVDVGGKCRGNSDNCCSGICDGSKPKKGKKDKSRCIAHHVGSCTSGQDSCPEIVPCGQNRECYQTTGKAGFCAAEGLCDCAPCKKDKDCELEFGPGAACIVCTTDCVGVNGSSGTACVPAAA
jgi:hypothetical protein